MCIYILRARSSRVRILLIFTTDIDQYNFPNSLIYNQIELKKIDPDFKSLLLPKIFFRQDRSLPVC